jgi:hypothetical protein
MVGLIERVKAFDILAPHLTNVKREELAAALAAKLLAEVGHPPAPPAMTQRPEPLVLVDLPERDEHDQTAAFLAARGLTGAEQVQAAGRASEFIKRHPTLTRVAALQLWWAGEHPAKESA